MNFVSKKTGSLSIRNDRRIKKFEFVEGVEYTVSDELQTALIQEGFITKTKKKGD